ncbi:uncharacterized protein E0L32_009335 [Thyridium curvatum]|uniref:LCCL domain-containing protein n=1 Tax=Thyridium curvatum TaxID=1093900 RepID=A0A507APX1_9PEZI|nr:uncharacterized protein E0L32_009335 [Thyridium curvatum]TPX09447.1 hypothetical protein E0L32_009335 [Thyridium curvatum]
MGTRDDHAAEYGARESDAVASRIDEEAQLLQVDELDYEEPDWSHHRRRTTRPPLVKKKKGFRFSGPHPPKIQKIRPWFPSVQQAPCQLLERVCPENWQKTVLFVVFVLVWLGAFVAPLRWALPVKAGDGDLVVNLDCIDTFWRRKNLCGLDGIDCRPFSNFSLAFRCPANCAGVKVLNPHAVGPQNVNYRPLVIGDGTYRGDSFICGAAIHAGIVSDSAGGCGRVSLVGEHADFPSTEASGIESIGFDAPFPLAFTFSKEAAVSCSRDPRDLSLGVSVFFTSALSIFMTATWQFFPIFTGIFAHVGFVSDPPGASFHSTSVLPDHLSAFAGRFLPAAFCAVVLYLVCVRRTLDGLAAQLEKTALWLGGFWFGALSNYTLDWIPIQRLTAHDLEQQPGAKAALAAILTLLLLVVLQQARSFWLEGRLPRMLALYGLLLAGLLLCLAAPGVRLRIHHYVLALLLLPGTALQTRPSLLYQGLLLGLFANGVARWGFAPLLQTPAALRGDGAYGAPLPSVADVAVSVSAGPAGGARAVVGFDWSRLVSPAFDGLSVLVNDVERHRDVFADTAGHVFNYTKGGGGDSYNAYVRFAYIKDGLALDYTEAGTFYANGTWGDGTRIRT